jgi:hypothetical protein
MENQDKEIDLHKLMISDILRIRSDALLIPVFNNEQQSFVPNWAGSTLRDISDIDCNFFKRPTGGPDLKHCHFNDENNLIFARHVINWIEHETPLRIDLREYQAPTKPIEYYFKV